MFIESHSEALIGGRLNARPKLSYMASIPVERLSPLQHRLSQPALNLIFQEFKPIESSPVLNKPKKKTKKGKKKKKKPVSTAKIQLNTPHLDTIPDRNGHQKPELGKVPEKVLVDNEEGDSFVEFELNDVGEAQELNDLLEDEIIKIKEQQDHIRELETHVKKEIKVIFKEPINKSPSTTDSSLFFSTFKGLQQLKSKIDVKNKKKEEGNEEYLLLNQAIKLRLKELEKKQEDLTGFKGLLKECLEQEAKIDDEDFVNILDNEFNRVKLENDFLKAYKNIKDEEIDPRNEIGKLRSSIMKQTHGIKENKRNLFEIRKKYEGKKNANITEEEIERAREGLGQELAGMISSLRDAKFSSDFF